MACKGRMAGRCNSSWWHWHFPRTRTRTRTRIRIRIKRRRQHQEEADVKTKTSTGSVASATCFAAWFLLMIVFQCSSSLAMAQAPPTTSFMTADVGNIQQGNPLTLSKNEKEEEGETDMLLTVNTPLNDAPNMAIEDGLINKDWVVSAVDATVSTNLFWPELEVEVEVEGKNQSQNESSTLLDEPGASAFAEQEQTQQPQIGGSSSSSSSSPPNTNASVLAVTAQRFGYLNLRKKDTALGSVTHVCLDIYIRESKQTVLTAVGYAFRDGRALSISAHTILENNNKYLANAWNSMTIPLPDALDSYWYELRIEEKSVQGSVIYIQNAGFCDGKEKDTSGAGQDPNTSTNTTASQYKQCLWNVENVELKQQVVEQRPSPSTTTTSSTSSSMPFIEAVYLSGFGLSPFWVDKSFVGFYDFSYILPSGETAIKALVGPNGALSLASQTSFQAWEGLHFQILASSSEIDVCVEVSRNKESRGESQCLQSLWNQSTISGAWVDVNVPLSDFGDLQPWNRFSLADGSTAGVFYLVTNILFNAKNDSSTNELWVLDIIDSPPELSGFLDREEVPATHSKSSHTLGWSIGIVVGVVAALIVIPILLCVIYPKQPGRRLTSIPLFCVAAHETVKEVLEDIVSPRFRFRVPVTVKMKAADKKGWVENENSGSQEEGWGHFDSNTNTNIEGILPVYGESGGEREKQFSEDNTSSVLSPTMPVPYHSPTSLGSKADKNTTTTTTAASTTPLSTRRQIMYPTHRGGSCTMIETRSLVTNRGGMSDSRPLYRRSSILESDSECSSYMDETSPSPIPIAMSARTEKNDKKASTLQHMDEALKCSCKMLMESSSDLKKLFAYNRPKGKFIRRVASETIDVSIASDYHTLIERQIASLQNAQRIIEEEWKVMKEIGSAREEQLTSKQQIVSRIPSRTDIESMNVDVAKDVQITGLIGSGGNGNVYHGFYKGHRVAIKMLHNNSAFTYDQLNSLKTEVELLQNLRHPNIVNFLGSCLNPPQVCVILEYAEGGSLHNMLHTNQKQPEYGTLLQLAEDVASAMDYCHGLDPPIIHRDLKPQNILLRRDGRAQVADFGIARMRQTTFVETKHLNAGTVAYMSPEIMQGRKVDEKCDVYSFGVIMWECLTGEKPWSDKLLPMQVVVAVGVEGDRLPVPLECPISLKRLIKDCWRHDPRLRPTFREIKLRLAYIRNKHGTHHR